MNEIEKLYENVGVKPINIAEYGSTYIPKKIEINGKPYPPFTAEKQLELLKLCFDKYEKLEKVRSLKERCIIYYRFDEDGYTEFVNCETWEETIAGLVNNLWQDLTEEGKEQVKGILE